MRRLFFALTLSLAASSALAGSLTFQVTNSTDGTVSKTYSQFSDAHITRWIAANQNACNIDKNGTCTRVQVLNYIVSKFVADQIALVKSAETDAATTSAAAGITPITVLP